MREPVSYNWRPGGETAVWETPGVHGMPVQLILLFTHRKNPV